MRVFGGPVDFDLDWLDGKEMPLEAIEYARNAVDVVLGRFGPVAASDKGVMEFSAQMRATGTWYYGFVECDGSGVMRVQATLDEALAHSMVNQTVTRLRGHAGKPS